MLTRSRLKWMGTILVAGIALALALTGGKWGTSYAADAGVNVPPVINELLPDAAPVGASDKYIVITGTGFGSTSNTLVRVRDTTIDRYLDPPNIIIPGALIVKFPSDLFTHNTIYLVTVVVYSGTIPTIPPFEESNPLPFNVYIPKNIYLPIITQH